MRSAAAVDRFTFADLERVPDDGLRYEVLNGSLTVTPPASYAHNRRAQRVGLALLAAAPPGVEVLLTGTQSVRLDDDALCPDVVVFAAGEYGLHLPADAVLLVVEVTSPSNRSTDTVTKLERYARAGIPHYWIVDPEQITVHRLDAERGAYDVVVRGPVVQVGEPFPVEVAGG